MRKLRWLLLGLYITLVLLLVSLAVYGSIGDPEALAFSLALIAFALLSQLLFLFIRGRPEYLAPIRPRRLLLPALVAGLMMTVLAGGLLIALWELVVDDNVSTPILVCFWLCLLLNWVVWAAAFYVHCRRLDRFQATRRIVLWLLAGSLLQLLVTVPAHLIVSRRPGCFTGLMTMTGLLAGVYVIMWAFGPGIMLLFWVETYKRMAGHCPECGYNLRGLSQQRCPECGRPFTFPEVRKTAEELGFVRAPDDDVA